MCAFSLLRTPVIRLVGILLQIPSAAAAALPYTQTLVETGQPTGGVLSFPQFDPGLGVLDNVTITVESATSLTATITGTNPGGQPDSLGANLSGRVLVMMDGLQVQAPVSGTASLSLEPGATQSASLIASTVATTQPLPVPPASEWIGSGVRSVPWQFVDLNTTFTGAMSTGSAAIQSLSLTVTVTYNYTRLLEPDPGKGTIRFTEDGRPMRIEFAQELREDALWRTILKTGTNPVGTVIDLPLDGDSGFYRVLPEP